MEIMLALILFSILIAFWVALPSSPTAVAAVESTEWASTDGLQVAGVDA